MCRRQKKINSIVFEEHGDYHQPNVPLEIVSRKNFSAFIWDDLSVNPG
jgi:hypothetical protein